jgi:ADP-ribose pyrophosphatase YjhB (NUDIX family)
MEIIKPVAVFIKDRQFLVARDTIESFFKNVGGRVEDGESDIDCLRRVLKTEWNYELVEEPELLFVLPATPAVGNPGDTVVLRAYLIEKDATETPIPTGDVAESLWVDSKNAQRYQFTPQINDLIIPKLFDLGLID